MKWRVVCCALKSLKIRNRGFDFPTEVLSEYVGVEMEAECSLQ